MTQLNSTEIKTLILPFSPARWEGGDMTNAYLAMLLGNCGDQEKKILCPSVKKYQASICLEKRFA